MRIFDACLLRLKQAVKATDDQEVAELLGMTKAAFSDRKRRDSFPADKVRALAQQRPDLGIDVEHVLTGVSTPTTNTLAVLRECTEQVMRLGLSSTESIAVRDIVYGARTGNRQLVEDGIALLSAGVHVIKAKAPESNPKPAPNSIQVGNMTNHGAGGVQVGYAGGKVTSKVITKVKKPKE